jgi:hypothetical protein
MCSIVSPRAKAAKESFHFLLLISLFLLSLSLMSRAMLPIRAMVIDHDSLLIAGYRSGYKDVSPYNLFLSKFLKIPAGFILLVSQNLRYFLFVSLNHMFDGLNKKS